MSKASVIPQEVVMSKIYEIREQKVMLDMDLGELYGVETKQLKRQVKRNIGRFPKDFMFELSLKEFNNLRYQIGTSKWGGLRYAPMAFTEQGVAMLSSILTSERAMNVNIRIIKIFTNMREMLLTHKDLQIEMEKIQKKVSSQDERIDRIFDYLNRFIKKLDKPRKQIGFKLSKGKK